MYSDLLTQLSDQLTDESWLKDGNYFAMDDKGKLCFCVHGGVQILINPVIAEAVKTAKLDPIIHGIISSASEHGGDSPASTAIYASNITETLKNRQTFLQVWQKRPVWVRKDLPSGNLNLHFLLGMFGITPERNDHEETSLKKMKSKIKNIAIWAKDNEKFLMEN